MQNLKNNFYHIFPAIFIIATLIFYNFHVLAKSPPPGTGKADVKANILLMLDNSGSMGRTTSNPNKPLYPFDVAVDSSGNVYVTEYYYHKVKKYNSSGTYLKSIGSYGTRNWNFRYPTSIDVDSNDNIYILDYYNRRFVSYDSDGNYRCSSAIPHGHSTYLYDDIEINSNDVIYISNYFSKKVFLFNTNCRKNGGSDEIYINEYIGPMAIDSSDNVWLHKIQGRALLKYDSTVKNFLGYQNLSYGCPAGTKATYITDLEADSNGNVYYSDLYCNVVVKYDTNINYQSKFGSFGTGASQWRYSYGFDIYNDEIYLADFNNHRILNFTLTGTKQSTIGQSDDRMTIAKRVIKKLVSNSDLTTGANFGLMEWGSSNNTKIRVKISDQGAKQIFTDIDNVKPGGGTYLGQAMQKAYNYYKGSDSPINQKANCQNNFVIVISDGDWFGSPNPNAVAKNMLNGDGIKTFVIGFQGYANKSNYTNLAKAGGTKTPLFADDEAALLQKLTDAIRQVLASKLTFTSPAIMPDLKYGDHIFQSLFNYKQDSQWEGHLIKYALNANGTVGNKIWDAGVKLNKVKASNRNVWTAGNNYPTGINNFTTGNLAYIKGELYDGILQESDADANKLIDFIRGIDSYDEDSDGSTTDERWKLADIYHSQISIVGPPSAPVSSANSYTESFYRNANQYQNFRTSNLNRKQTILAGSNGGMLHAFTSTTGEELWTFIPPSLLSKLRDVVTSKSKSSNSIYGVDGSPIVKDIYYDNKWRTVVLTGLGKGGHSYFALDITDIDNPTHLFTFDNDPSQQVISYWDSSGIKSEYSYASAIPSEYDYSKLGESWSTPRILRIKISNKDKWVAVFGAGFNNGVNTNYGSSVFVIDMEDGGKVLQHIDVADKSGNSVVNSVPSSVIPIIADGSSLANYYGAIAYFADYEGKLWKLNLTDKGTLYDIQQLFDAESTETNGRRVMKDVVVSIDTNNTLWIYYGTGDQQQLQKESTSLANRLYGLKDIDFPNYNSSGSTFLVAQCRNVTSKSANCPTDSEKGWYINLEQNEKTTGKATVSNRTVYFPRYIPNSKNPCNPGNAHLSSHDYKCGNVLQNVSLGAGVASEAIIYKNKIYLGLSGITSSGTGTGSSSSGSGSGATSLPTGWVKKDNLIVGTPPAGRGAGGTNTITIESWRHVF